MSAGFILQAAVVGRLQSLPDVQGIFDGPPARPAYPYLIVDCGTEIDWSAEDLNGRDVAVVLTVWDDRPARLQSLADRVERLFEDDLVVAHWRVVSWRFLRRRTLRDVAGPWATALEFRARLIERTGGEE